MPEFYNGLVFQPNREATSLEYVHLAQTKRHMKFVSHPPGLGQVAYIFLSAARLHHIYASAPQDDSVSGVSRSPAVPRRTLATARRSKCASGAAVDMDGEADAAATPLVVLYSHGNAEDLGGCYQMLKWFSVNFNIDLVCYDYRGYGYSGHTGLPASQFRPTEESVYEDAELMYNHVINLGYHPSRIIIMGRSLGGGPACHLARQHHQEIAGLILESTFSSCLSVIHPWLPLLKCFDMFENKTCIEEVTGCPVLFMHGDCDSVVPFRCSGELMKTALAARRKRLKAAQRATSSSAKGGQTQPRQQQCNKQPASSSTLSGCSVLGGGDVASQQQQQQGRAATGHSPDAPTALLSVYESAEALAVSAALAKAGLRSYAGGSHITSTAEERELGIFYQWFPGCNHNDVERRLTELYGDTISRFLRFVAETTPLPATLRTALSLAQMPSPHFSTASLTLADEDHSVRVPVQEPGTPLIAGRRARK